MPTETELFIAQRVLQTISIRGSVSEKDAFALRIAAKDSFDAMRPLREIAERILGVAAESSMKRSADA